MRIQVSEPGTNVSVETADRSLGPKGHIVLQCKTLCDTVVLRGLYKLVLRRDGEITELDSDVVSLRRPLQYTTLTVDTGLRLLGGGLFIAGVVAVAGGLVALFPMLMSSMCHGGDSCDRHITLGRVGLAAAGTGSLMALIGALLYSGHRTSFKREQLAERAPSLSLQLLPGRAEITGVLTGRF